MKLGFRTLRFWRRISYGYPMPELNAGRMDSVEDALLDIAKGLAPSLLKTAARRLRDEALGDDQERALNEVFRDATAAVLVEITRHDREDPGLPDRLAAEFERFYGDTWVAETLVDFAISAEEPPVDGLRRRYAAVGNDPDALLMDYGEAMRLLIYEVADGLRKEASRAGSPLTNLVQVRQLGIIRGNQEELVRRLEPQDGDTGASAETAGERWRRDRTYERGPDGASYDVLFAGFFLPSGPDGRLTAGGSSRALEARFAEILGQELENHRLNTSGMELAGVAFPVRLLDHRPPTGYAGDHDIESFSRVTEELAERSLGVVWGIAGEGGDLQDLEVAVNPDRFYGGPLAPGGFSGVKRLADRGDLPSSARVAFAARVLAAMWAQSFCAELDRRGMHAESYRVASDSRRLIERALDDVRRALSPREHPAVEEQRRDLIPGIVRQEASSLWRRGEEREALGRLADALKIWPYGPLSGPGEFREFCESDYAFALAGKLENFERFVEENYEDAARSARRGLARQYARRALVGLPPVDFELFVGWVEEAVKRGVDVEEDAERWFSEMAAAYPEDPFVLAYWGEARRLIALRKYGAGFGSPTSWRMDRAAEKFEEAYAMQSNVPYFATRVQAIKFTAATAFAYADERERKFDEAADWWQKAKPYYREHAPWMLEPGPADQPERLGRWVGEGNDGEGGTG